MGVSRRLSSGHSGEWDRWLDQNAITSCRGNGRRHSTGDAMSRGRISGYGRVVAVRGTVLLVGCAFGQSKPAWIDGVSPDYPSAQYLTGVGQADNSAVAEHRAYAALARICKAAVSAQSKDWESYLVVEQRGTSHDARRAAARPPTPGARHKAAGHGTE